MSLPVLRTTVRRVAAAGPSTTCPARALSTSYPLLAKAKSKSPKKKRVLTPANPDALPLQEAVRVLRAFEIANATSAYIVELKTKEQKVLLRGGAHLPTDPRRTQDVIVVFADSGSTSAEAAEQAGATIIGGLELVSKILNGEIVPTKVLSTPQLLPGVTRQLARFLGPKNLMPTAKRGLVGEGPDLGRLVKDAGGALDWRADKEGVIKSLVARASMPAAAVEKNIRAFIQDVHDQAKRNLGSSEDALEAAARATFVTKIRLETTNGPMIEINDIVA